MKKHIIAIIEAKGGSGKTATAGALAQCAVNDGKRTLAIDLDPQKSLTYWYGVRNAQTTVYNVFLSGDIKSAIEKTPSGVDIVPGSGNLIAVKTSRESAHRLEKAIDTVRRQYDYIVIDTGPGMGELVNNAVFACNEVLIPLEADIMSINGLLTVKGIIDKARESKRNLGVLGALTTMYDKRTTADRELREKVIEYCTKYGIPYLGEVRRCTKVRESMAMRTPLYTYAPKCNASVDYLHVYREIEEGTK